MAFLLDILLSYLKDCLNAIYMLNACSLSNTGSKAIDSLLCFLKVDLESIRNEPIKYSSLICYHKNNNNISLPGPPAVRDDNNNSTYHHKITLLSITPLC